MSDAVISRRGNINSNNNSISSNSIYATLRINTYPNIKVTCVNEDNSKSYKAYSYSNGVAFFNVGYGLWYINCEYKGNQISTTQYVDILQIYNIYLPDRRTYGIEVDQTTGKCVYTDDATEFTPVSYDEEGQFNYGDWNDIVTDFIGCRPCLLNTDAENEEERVIYLNPNDYNKTLDGNNIDISGNNVNGNVMVEFAPLWYKFSSNDNILKFQISNYDRSSEELGNFTLGCFRNKEDPIYYSAYDGSYINDTIRSLSGKTPKIINYDTYSGANPPVYNPTDHISVYINNNGEGYYTERWAYRSYILGLLLLLTKNVNVGKSLYGESSNTYPVVSGLLDKCGLFAKNNNGIVKCLGIENLWGKYSICAGLTLKSSATHTSSSINVADIDGNIIGTSSILSFNSYLPYTFSGWGSALYPKNQESSSQLGDTLYLYNIHNSYLFACVGGLNGTSGGPFHICFSELKDGEGPFRDGINPRLTYQKPVS